jgi:lipid-binding SYLF domain-containing protein
MNLLLMGLAALLVSMPAAAQDEEAERLRLAATVFEEMMSTPDKAIPNAILRRAEAIAIFPSTIKGGFIFGGHRGRGIISVRDTTNDAWSTPAFLTLTGGSFGLQIGGQAVDVILVVMNERGLQSFLSNEFTVGVGASAVAGPLGRDAEAATDVVMQAEILSYSRTRGIFAGLTIKGSSIRSDDDANERFYGTKYDTRGLFSASPAPAPADRRAVTEWSEVLEAYRDSSP